MVNTDVFIEREFARIGARVAIRSSNTLGLDVLRDRRGEYFEIRLPGAATAAVLDRSHADRHLLLLVNSEGVKSRFLFGHDERHWFVAAIPESARAVTGIGKAKVALQPAAVREAADRLRSKYRLRRRNSAYARQGEWFFVPAPDVKPNPISVLRREPLSRGLAGKPHMMELAYRRGGVSVYVNRQHPAGVTHDEFDALPEVERQDMGWRAMVRDAEVFAQGRITHRDHATLVLRGWHRVFMNTEFGALAMLHVTFLD